MTVAATRIILGAQLRMWLNFYRRYGPWTLVLSTVFSAIWYGGFAGIAAALANFLASPASIEALTRFGGAAFFVVFLYWQGMPLMMASVGAMLDWKKLVTYPVAEQQLFRVELLLRTVFFAEMPLVMLGVAIGLLRNPALPRWSALAPILFALFNLALGAGLRDLVTRLFARPRFREIAILGLILAAALPSLLIDRSVAGTVREWFQKAPVDWLPWGAAAAAARGRGGPWPWLALLALTLAAWWFSRGQFRRALTFEPDTARPSERSVPAGGNPLGLPETMYRLPSRIFRDPLGALVEKEIRFLSRVSRFRIVFLMGFTFGLLIWLPLASGRGGNPWMSANFLSVVAVYALVLLSEVCFYNTFGFDRAAAQMYFLTPVRPATVLAAKNLAAAFFVAAEFSLVAAACWLFRMPVTWAKVGEAVGISAVMTLFLLGIGNLGSTRSPRSQNPTDGWRRTAGSKFAFLALACYPLISIPIAMAYLARWAVRAEWAFYAVLAVGLVVAGCFYLVSVESAVETMDRNRERFLGLLSQGDAPVV